MNTSFWKSDNNNRYECAAHHVTLAYHHHCSALKENVEVYKIYFHLLRNRKMES
jgi:hypothetical protein